MNVKTFFYSQTLPKLLNQYPVVQKLIAHLKLKMRTKVEAKVKMHLGQIQWKGPNKLRVMVTQHVKMYLDYVMFADACINLVQHALKKKGAGGQSRRSTRLE